MPRITAHHTQLTPVRTYATRANAIKAVEKVYGPNNEFHGGADVHYFIMVHSDGRFFPVFYGMHALENMVHFTFNCIA